MDESNFRCSYCRDAASEWDHFRPLVKDKQPTGYITEIHNLVPACGKCNQSKGNKDWKTWMLGDAELSPTQDASPVPTSGSNGSRRMPNRNRPLESTSTKSSTRRIGGNTGGTGIASSPK